MTTSELIPVQFHEDTIYSVDYNGEPYTPVKPIIENLGLDWRSQAAKIRNNKERWGVAMITTPSKSGDQEYVCMPVRKLPGFLATINPVKVANHLRSKIVRYQDECDDVLWNYWTKGRAINPRFRAETKQKPEPTRNRNLSPEQIQDIDRLMLEKMSCWNPERHNVGREAFIKTIRENFQVKHLEEIPQDKFDEIVKFIQSRYNHPHRIGIAQDIESHCPNVIDDLLQYMLYRVNAILEDLQYVSDRVARHNITIELTMITSALGAVFPEEMQWLRLGGMRNQYQVECSPLIDLKKRTEDLNSQLEKEKTIRQAISDKKTATALGKLGGLTKQFDKMKRENDNLKIRLEQARKSLCGADGQKR